MQNFYDMFKKILIIFLFFILFQQLKSQPLSLIYPTDNFITSDTSITFEWNNVDTYNTYNIQIDTNANFSQILIDSNGILSNSILIDNLTVGKMYYWRVRGLDGVDSTNWSNARNFIIFSPKSLSGLSLWLKADKGIIKPLVEFARS